MTEAVKLPKLTVEEYLQQEQHADVRHEYIRGQVFSMVGGTIAHNTIISNIQAILHSQVRGSGCRVFSSDMKVRLEESNVFYYPDVVLSCEKFEADKVFLAAPSLIVEVLSNSTAEIDRREKLAAYGTISSLVFYLVVAQKEKLVEVYRKGADGGWLVFHASGDSVEMESLPCGRLSLAISEIYAGVF